MKQAQSEAEGVAASASNLVTQPFTRIAESMGLLAKLRRDCARQEYRVRAGSEEEIAEQSPDEYPEELRRPAEHAQRRTAHGASGLLRQARRQTGPRGS